MNFYDSEKITDHFKVDGYKETSEIKEADLVVINTCHIREKASEKLFSELGRIKKIKDQTKLKIAVSGCVAQAEGDHISKRAPFVDFIVGPQSYHLLPKMVKDSDRKTLIKTDFIVDEKFEKLPTSLNTKNKYSSFVTVQEGCDKFCTFCVVPYTRGSEYSRSVDEIYNEVKKYTEMGVVEVTLLGQNVNAWHGKSREGKEKGLGYLIDKISNIDSLKRIRYTTSHPLDMDEELIEAHRDNKKLMPYLHLPIQSGSDKILTKMNRRHSQKEYLFIIQKIRDINPKIAISGDFIVGFPGETDSDFNETISVINEVKYSQAYSFKYSARSGTPASLMEDEIKEEIKSERLQEVQAILKKYQMDFNSSFLGKKIEVLIESNGKYKNQVIGRSPWMQSVNIENSNLEMGKIENVEVTFCGQNSLRAM